MSEILTTANLRHAASRIWAWAELSSGFVEWSCAVVITTTVFSVIRFLVLFHLHILYLTFVSSHFEFLFQTFWNFDNISFEPQLINSQTLPIDRYKQRNIVFRNLLHNFKDWGFSNLATCSNYSITSYVKISVFHFFEKVNKGQLKLVNVNH